MQTKKIYSAKADLKLEQKQEALKRMKMLNILGAARNLFRNQGIIHYSHNGILYFATEEMMQQIKQFEEKWNATVYHAIHTNTEIGPWLDLLYVSKHTEEWTSEHEELLQDNIVMSYNINNQHNEFGRIQIENHYGGIRRTA